MVRSLKDRLLGRYRIYRGDWRGAAKAYRRISEAHPNDATARFTYLQMVFRIKQYERIIEEVSDGTSDERLARLKVSAYMRLQEYDQAQAEARHFLDRFPGDYQLQKRLSKALLGQQEYDEARKVCEAMLTALEKETGNDPQLSACYHTIGYAYEMQGNQKKADEYYEKTLQHSQSEAAARLGIGVLHQRRGYLEQAVRAYEAKLCDEPDNAEIYFALGKIYSKQIKAIEAAEAYKQFVLHSNMRQPFNEKMVVFEVYQGRNYACSPRAIYEEMIADKTYKDFTFVWMLRGSSITRYWRLYLHPRTKVVRYKSRDYFLYYDAAKYWISNFRLTYVSRTHKKQVYVQTWHGTPLKKIGFSVVYKKDGASRLSNDDIERVYGDEAKKLDYLLSPSPIASKLLGESFGIERYGKPNAIIEEGYPRNDFLANHTLADEARIKKRLGIPANKKVLLYAPTWRDDQHDSERGHTFKTQADFDYLQEKLASDWVILFRAHYFIANTFNFNKYEGFIYNVSDVNDVNNLYVVADVLMTDYSSVFFDYANLRRPIIFFMYDLEHYDKNLRGFNIDLKELPGDIIKTEDEAIEILQDLPGYNKKHKVRYDAFSKKFNPLDDGKAAQRVVRKVFS